MTHRYTKPYYKNHEVVRSTYAVLTLTDELSLLLVVRLGKLTDLVCTEEATCADCH